MERPILVTGGLGFIGSAFIRRVASPSTPVVNVDARTYAASPMRVTGLPDGAIRHVEMDVADEGIRDLVSETKPRLVVHFAAESHVTRSETQEDTFMRTNVEGTRSVLEAARRAEVDRVVHISTDEVYGPCPSGAFSETEKEPGAGQATSAYARSKALADDVAQGFLDQMALTIVRPTNCFGPWQHPEKAIARWITRALTGRKLPVWGDGQQVREWMHVEDACEGIELLARAGEPGIYNLGPGGTERSNLDVARDVARLAQVEASNVYLTAYDRPLHDRRYAVDSSRATALGWAPRADFEDALDRTIAWYREHEDWWRPLVDVAEDLYSDEEVSTP